MNFIKVDINELTRGFIMNVIIHAAGGAIAPIRTCKDNQLDAVAAAMHKLGKAKKLGLLKGKFIPKFFECHE